MIGPFSKRIFKITRAGVMSENIVLKITHYCTFLCAILTNFVRDF